MVGDRAEESGRSGLQRSTWRSGDRVEQNFGTNGQSAPLRRSQQATAGGGRG